MGFANDVQFDHMKRDIQRVLCGWRITSRQAEQLRGLIEMAVGEPIEPPSPAVMATARRLLRESQDPRQAIDPRILKLGYNSVVLYHLLSRFYQGAMCYEHFLEEAVCALAEQNKAFSKAVTKTLAGGIEPPFSQMMREWLHASATRLGIPIDLIEVEWREPTSLLDPAKDA